jgi:hypothetical protein
MALRQCALKRVAGLVAIILCQVTAYITCMQPYFNLAAYDSTVCGATLGVGIAVLGTPPARLALGGRAESSFGSGPPSPVSDADPTPRAAELGVGIAVLGSGR